MEQDKPLSERELAKFNKNLDKLDKKIKFAEALVKEYTARTNLIMEAKTEREMRKITKKAKKLEKRVRLEKVKLVSIIVLSTKMYDITAEDGTAITPKFLMEKEVGELLSLTKELLVDLRKIES